MDVNKKNHFTDLLNRQKELNEIALEYMDGIDGKDNFRESLGELSSFDNHPADIGTEVFMVEHAMGLKAMHEEGIKKVEDAISRINKDNYGVCKNCDKEIDEERLEIVPETSLCIECAREEDLNIESAREAIKHRPPGYNDVVSEFGTKPVKDPLEDKDRGKDILTDLMKFGSAESPSEEGNFKDFNEFYNTKTSEDGIVEDVDKISNEEYIAGIPDQ